MKERERLKAARFAVEDKIAAPIDNQHIVLGAAKGGGGDARRLAVIDAKLLRGLLEPLEAQNISAERIFADFDWVTTAGPVRFSDRIILPCSRNGPDGNSNDYAGGYTVDPQWADESQASLPLSNWTQVEVDAGRALNLAQGVFSRRRRGGGAPIQGLGRIAAIFLFAGLAWLALQMGQVRAVAAQASALNAQTAALYAKAAGKPAPANPALAVTRAVKSKPSSGTDFLPLIARLNQAIAQTDGVAIESIAFDANNTGLELRLIYPEFGSAAQMQRAAQSTGGTFRAGGVREQNGKLIGDGVFTNGSGS
jgi:type II secretory pathway component PulL